MEEKKSVQDGLYLVKTKVGWILSGRVRNYVNNINNPTFGGCP